ncbi:DUF5819 family protein [Bacillus sp. H1a]|uniref:DUF5819 family protein n=1 Tax=Bacillus sp. H1a TaxID=1397276 RepID=UPI00046AF5C8|nr:DUF5819 family protein [Bacillus sp. H1a]
MDTITESKILKILVLFLSTILLIHFCIIMLSVMPPNPIFTKHKKLIDSYTSPVFSQNWHLFAPNPITKNYTVYIQAKVEGKKSNEFVTTDWIDTSTPLVLENKRNPISPINRLVRIPTGVQDQMHIQDETFIKYINKKENTDNDKMLKEIEKNVDERGQEILQRFGNSMATKYISDAKIKEVRVKWIIEDPVPFSKKDDKNYKTKTSAITFDWKPYYYVLPPL